jgi:hypothetical protein
MATPAQIAANRLNARKSTGPRTEAGKSVARFNALKHSLDAESVIIPGEDPEAYQALFDAYHREWDPSTPTETFHVETMIRADWTRIRLRRVEAQLHRTLLAESSGDLAAALLSESPAAKLLLRIQRQIAALERTWRTAQNELRRLYRDQEAERAHSFERKIAAIDHELIQMERQLGSFPPPAPRVDPAPAAAPSSAVSTPPLTASPSNPASA